MYEDLIGNNFIETFMNFYGAFLNWFTALPVLAQIFTGILIILGLVGLGYLIYGIIWLAYQLVKLTIIGTILLHYLMYVAFKMIIVVIVDSNKVEEQWGYSVKNMKWFVQVAYPSHKKEVYQEITTVNNAQSLGSVQQQKQVVIIKENPNFFCTACGTAFTPRMNKMLKERAACFCESCGQMYVSPAKTA